MPVTLSCPGCHAKHKFRDDIAVDRTVYVKCPACGHMMMISPQINNPAQMMPRPEAQSAAPALPPEVAAAIAAARANLWRLELLEFAREEMDTEQVCAHVASGAVGARDLVAHVDKNDWQRVEDVVDFMDALAARRKKEEAEERRRREDEAPVDEEEAVDSVPFWQDLPRALAYPVVGRGAVMLAVNALFLLLTSVSMASMPLLVFALAYALVIVRETASGRGDAPGWETFTDIMELFANSLRLLAVTLVAWLPVILLNVLIFLGPLGSLRAGSAAAARMDDPLEAELQGATSGLGVLGTFTVPGLVGNLALGLLVLTYYPMCVTLLAVHDDIAAALSPRRIFAAIHDFGSAYAAAMGFCMAAYVVTALGLVALSLVGSAAGMPGLASIPGSFLAIYAAFVSLHVLGRMVHESGDAAGFEEVAA